MEEAIEDAFEEMEKLGAAIDSETAKGLLKSRVKNFSKYAKYRVAIKKRKRVCYGKKRRR